MSSWKKCLGPGPAVLCWGLLATLAPRAQAHVGHDVLRAERYLKVHVAPEELRIVASLTLGEQETLRMMQAADADEDGSVSQAEADAYMRRWAEGLATELPVFIDGQETAAPWGEPYLDPLGAVAALPGAVEMIARIPVGGGPHELRLCDGMQREKFDRTDVVFQVDEETTIQSAGPVGEESLERRRFFFANEASAPECFEATFVLPGPTQAQRWGMGLGIGVCLVGVLALGIRRSRRRASPRPR